MTIEDRLHEVEKELLALIDQAPKERDRGGWEAESARDMARSMVNTIRRLYGKAA